jgi:kinesin family protein 4/21/27
MAENQNIRVALRVRPAIVSENSAGVVPANCVQIVQNEPQVIVGREASRKTFTYDYVYGPSSTQNEIYKELAAPLVNQFLGGFNATILAYGQTFSGKTYTMGSSNEPNTSEEELGILPRVFNQLYDTKFEDDGLDHVFKVSFLEIYQEKV